MRKYLLTTSFKRQAMVACLLLAVAFAYSARLASAAETGEKPRPAAERKVVKGEEKKKNIKEIKPPDNPLDVVPPDVKTQEDFLPDLEEQEPIVPAYSVWRVVFGLGFVIGLILLISYLLRFLSNRGLRLELKGHHIRILDNIQLGINRTLYLVQVGAKIVLLASTDKGLSYLTEVTDPEDIRMFMEDIQPAPPDTSFTGQLRSAAARGGKQKPGSGESAVDKLKERLTKLSDES